MNAITLRDQPAAVIADDFLEWLSERNGAAATCPICSYVHWNLLTDNDECSLIGANAFPITAGNSGWGKPFIQLQCKRCAYVALFSALTISEWVKNGKPKFEEGGEDGR